MGKEYKRDKELKRLQRCFIPMLCVFLDCLFLPVIGAEMGQNTQNPSGSVDALEKIENDIMAEMYMKYIESPKETDVYYELFENGDGVWIG